MLQTVLGNSYDAWNSLQNARSIHCIKSIAIHDQPSILGIDFYVMTTRILPTCLDKAFAFRFSRASSTLWLDKCQLLV